MIAQRAQETRIARFVIRLVVVSLCFGGPAALWASTTEQKFQAADTELNRVYKLYRSSLPDGQKEELQRHQRLWLAEMEEAVAAKVSAGDKLDLRLSMTIERTAQLTSMMTGTAARDPMVRNC